MSDELMTTEDFYAGLSEEDREAAWREILLYGEAFARTGPDGVKRLIPRELITEDMRIMALYADPRLRP